MSAGSNDERNHSRTHDGCVGVAIIGLGFMGRTHLAAFAKTPHCALRAVLDPARTHAAAGNLITTNTDADALIASLDREDSLTSLLARSDIDLVSICTPTETHVALVSAAIEAGKHVLIEKPVALDARRIDALDHAATAAGVLVMPAHCMRFWPAWTWMAEAIASGRYGAVRRAKFRRLGAAPSWSQDFYLDFNRSGGAVVDLHIHDADFIRFAFGEPTSVHASGTRKHVIARYGFAHGADIEAEGGWMDDPAFAFTMTARIECEHATMDFCIGRSPELMLTPTSAHGAATAQTIEVTRDYPAGNGYEHEIAALIAAIREGRQAPVTLKDAAATQRLLDREIEQLA